MEHFTALVCHWCWAFSPNLTSMVTASEVTVSPESPGGWSMLLAQPHHPLFQMAVPKYFHHAVPATMIADPGQSGSIAHHGLNVFSKFGTAHFESVPWQSGRRRPRTDARQDASFRPPTARPCGTSEHTQSRLLRLPAINFAQHTVPPSFERGPARRATYANHNAS